MDSRDCPPSEKSDEASQFAREWTAADQSYATFGVRLLILPPKPLWTPFGIAEISRM
jgi:hypothetical protein